LKRRYLIEFYSIEYKHWKRAVSADDAESESDNAGSESDDAESESDNAESESDNAESESDDAESESDNAESESDDEEGTMSLDDAAHDYPLEFLEDFARLLGLKYGKIATYKEWLENNPRQPITECGVCLEVFDSTDDADYCRAKCGQNICRTCLCNWKVECGKEVICVYCRSPWIGKWDLLQSLKKNVTACKYIVAHKMKSRTFPPQYIIQPFSFTLLTPHPG
jgi:hypothetical protein